MDSPFHHVARGLRIAHIGYLITCWAATSAAGIAWALSTTYYGNRELYWPLIISFWTTVAVAVAGVVVGIVGRVRCLRVPAEFPAVRGRVIAAVVLEASGWGSLLVGVGVFFAMIYRVLPRAEWVPAIGMILSGLMLLCGRILFLRFLRVLAREVEDKSTDRRSRLSLALFLTDWAVGLVGVGVAAGGSMLRLYELTTPVVTVLWIAAGMSGLYGLILYDRLLGGLARSVQAFADASTEEDYVESATDDADDPNS